MQEKRSCAFLPCQSGLPLDGKWSRWPSAGKRGVSQQLAHVLALTWALDMGNVPVSGARMSTASGIGGKAFHLRPGSAAYAREEYASRQGLLTPPM